MTSHPDHNVIVSTHEHVMPKTLEETAHRSSNSRWVSHGAELWERVIAPNRNVVIVLSGHFHGLGQLVTENAGGLEGHTVVELLADYQEFRTHTGERATGFFRMLQFDLDQGAIAVDTRSMRLDAAVSADTTTASSSPTTGSPPRRPTCGRGTSSSRGCNTATARRTTSSRCASRSSTTSRWRQPGSRSGTEPAQCDSRPTSLARIRRGSRGRHRCRPA